MAVEVDGRFDAIIGDECIEVERDERGREHRSHELPYGGAQPAFAPRKCVPELAGHVLRAGRLCAGDTAGVEHERGCPAGGELCDASERVGGGERAVELGLDDRIELAWFMAAVP